VVEGIFPLSITASLQGRTPTVLDLITDPAGADVLVAGRFVGKTDQDGSVCLKYLPMGRPIPILVRKEGWVAQEASQVEFSETNTHVILPPFKLKSALAALELTTAPGDVAVKIDGRPAGKTNAEGKLTVDEVQVAVNNLIQMEKDGFESESFGMAVPVGCAGKRFQADQVRLKKVAHAAPMNRVQRDYAVGKTGETSHSMTGQQGPRETGAGVSDRVKLAYPRADDFEQAVREQLIR